MKKVIGTIVVLGFGLLLLTLASAMGVVAQSGEKTTSAKLDVGAINSGTVKFQDSEREFKFYVPKGFDETQQHPLIFALHGHGRTPQDAIDAYNSWHKLADQDGTIIVYPAATGTPGSEKFPPHWNDLAGPPAPPQSADDMAFIAYLMDYFVRTNKGDASRTYLTGISNGGAFTYNFSLLYPDKVAAIAPVVAMQATKMAEKYPKAVPLPILMVNGSADPLIPSSGGVLLGGMTDVLSVKDNIEFWKKRNGITTRPILVNLQDVTDEINDGRPTPSYLELSIWPGNGKNDMMFLNVINGGHNLPILGQVDLAKATGGNFLGVQNGDLNAAMFIYEFFLSHTR